MKNKRILMLLFFITLSLFITGCGKDNKKNNSDLNKDYSDNALQMFVENGIDLASIKPEKTVETKTYKEAGIKDIKGVLFYLDSSAKTIQKDEIIRILNYLQAISSDDAIYNEESEIYDFVNELKDNSKSEKAMYYYGDEKVKVKIEYVERKCERNKQCETYGIIFE